MPDEIGRYFKVNPSKNGRLKSPLHLFKLSITHIQFTRLVSFETPEFYVLQGQLPLPLPE